MTPHAFVAALKESVRKAAASEAECSAAPLTAKPTEHLSRFSAWFRQLTPNDQEIAREVIQFSAEGSLFGLLTYLDNIASLTEEGGVFELWHVGEGGERIRLNDPDGELLTDLFNNLA